MRLLVLVFCVFFAVPVHAGSVRVAVASNFVSAMESLARTFEAQTSHRVQIMAGSSGAIYAQLRQGAPFDLFLSADAARPAQLVADGLARPKHRASYALGALAFWTMEEGAPFASQSDVAAYLKTLRPRGVALANPQIAPYGLAAQQILTQLGLGKVNPVMGQNVGQAFALVASGNAQAGFVAASQLKIAFPEAVPGRAWPVPEGLHEPIEQDMVLLARARGNAAARALFAWLQFDEARARIAGYGYRLPERP